ncbi:MAG: YdcF family protein [Leptolyngbya sp. SIO3F4]|nr:YdcF family protein [Leptolyngbya sp. SIO3F4]
MFESEELLHRIFCDPLPVFCEAAYLFGQTSDNESSVFQRAQKLVDQGQTSAIWIPGTEAMSGYPGQTAWRDRISTYVVSTLVKPVPMGSTESLNTLIEAQGTIRFAKAQGVMSLVVVAAPFHQQRAVMTTISVALAEYPALRIYSAPGMPIDWQRTVVHSQGTLQGKCFELIYGEQERIEKYRKKGDLVSHEVE